MSESMNREEAARVLQRASERLRDGNLEGALKDVRKSIQMAPTAEAEYAHGREKAKGLTPPESLAQTSARRDHGEDRRGR